ncbi:MAG: type I restriction-modification enzyme R subunit C-terminal domain-containing protein, partial [Limnothrix sp.]
YGPPVFQILKGLEGAYNVALMKAIPNEEIILKDFLFIFLQTPKIQNYIIQLSSRAAGQSGVNKKTLNAYPIPVPPLEEQKQIVKILDEVFEAIALVEANTKKNLANARELFDSYLNDVFSQDFEGEFQELGIIAKLIDSLHQTPKYIEEGGYPMLRVKDISSGFINLNSAFRVSKETFKEFSKRHLPQKGDIVLSRVGSYGVPAFVTTEELFCLGQNTVFIIPTLWSRPDTRKSLLIGLAEKGYGDGELKAIARITNTEKSDIYDVLTYIAYAAIPLTRKERVSQHQDLIFSKYTGKQQEFLDFVLDQYVREGVEELDRSKLPKLIEIKYHTVNEGLNELGRDIGNVFADFQAYLYSEDAA